MIKSISKYFSQSVRVTVRTQQIGLVFSSYGIWATLASLGFEMGKRGLTLTKLMNFNERPLDEVFGQDLARTFAKLGPTFIKLGQVLATRPDLVGDPVADQLKVLFDNVPPIPYREIRSILKKEIGKQNLRRWFHSIDHSPLASASLGQTHRAVLKDGTPLILKVQKTGVANTVRTDLIILEGFVRSLHLLYPKYNFIQMFEDFKQGTLREIDYREEAKNIVRFRKNYRKLFRDSNIVFPRYFPDLTTERVLAMEPMHGKKVSEIKKGSTVAKQVASMSLTAILEQIFDHGFFHADPHAGNLFFLEEEGQLGFIDLGLVGQLEPEDKQKFLKVLLSILQRDRATLAQNLFALGVPGKKTDYAIFEKQIQALLDDVKAHGLGSLRMDQLVNKLLGIGRGNGLVIPNRYVLMIRSCLVIEGLAKSLDPSISIFNVAAPIVAKSLAKSYSPWRIVKKLFP